MFVPQGTVWMRDLLFIGDNAESLLKAAERRRYGAGVGQGGIGFEALA